MKAIGDPQDSFAYWGDRPDWLVAYSQHRDSDCLERSNFRSFARELGLMVGEPLSDGSSRSGDTEDAAIESCSHFLVGWVEYLLVRPGSEAETAADAMLARLDDYPVVDDEDWSNLEHEEACLTVENFIQSNGRYWPVDASDAALFIVQQWNDTSWLVDNWPDLKDSRHRQWCAAGLREYRAYKRAS